MNRLRLVQEMVASIRIPEMAIVEYKNVCIPPRTLDGIAAKTAPNLPKIPIMIMITLAHHPARLLCGLYQLLLISLGGDSVLTALLVTTITPLLPARWSAKLVRPLAKAC